MQAAEPEHPQEATGEGYSHIRTGQKVSVVRQDCATQRLVTANPQAAGQFRSARGRWW